MTFEERLAELGIELRDLDSIHFIRRSMSIYEKFVDIAEEKAKKIDGDIGVTLAMAFIDAINERDDIIDRMETRLDNVLRERDYLMQVNGYDPDWRYESNY